MSPLSFQDKLVVDFVIRQIPLAYLALDLLGFIFANFKAMPDAGHFFDILLSLVALLFFYKTDVCVCTIIQPKHMQHCLVLVLNVTVFIHR